MLVRRRTSRRRAARSPGYARSSYNPFPPPGRRNLNGDLPPRPRAFARNMTARESKGGRPACGRLPLKRRTVPEGTDASYIALPFVFVVMVVLVVVDIV